MSHSHHFSISDCENGFVKCSSCSKHILLDGCASLQIVKCPKCGSPEFIPRKIAGYWLYKPLGGGGMGSVYRATHVDDRRRDFAVKILPKLGGDPNAIQAIFREGHAGLNIGSHPHVVEVVELGETDSHYFLASEYISGERLDIFIEQEEEIPENSALKLMRQILEAEMHIVKSGYLFRDLKPENVIIEANGNVRLFDYGLAIPVVEAANPADTDIVEGSPYYVPPERLILKPEGEFSEIYSMGMLFYYILTGTNYYKKAEATKLARKHVKSLRIGSVATRLKYCSKTTVAIIDKMICRDAQVRYQTFRDLMVDFDSVQIEDTRGWIRKHIELDEQDDNIFKQLAWLVRQWWFVPGIFFMLLAVLALVVLFCFRS